MNPAEYGNDPGARGLDRERARHHPDEPDDPAEEPEGALGNHLDQQPDPEEDGDGDGGQGHEARRTAQDELDDERRGRAEDHERRGDP